MVHSLRTKMHGWWPRSFKPLDRQLHFHLCHGRTANRRTITWHKTANCNTLYISLLLFVLSLFQRYILVYKYKYCEIKFSNEKYRHSPVDWYTDTYCCMWNYWDTRNLLITLNLQWMSLHRRTKWKNVMDTWQAPYQNSNDYWWFTYGKKSSGRNFVLTLVILTVSTQCYTKGSHKEGELQTNHSPVEPHHFLGGEKAPSKMHLHTC